MRAVTQCSNSMCSPAGASNGSWPERSRALGGDGAAGRLTGRAGCQVDR